MFNESDDPNEQLWRHIEEVFRSSVPDAQDGEYFFMHAMDGAGWVPLTDELWGNHPVGVSVMYKGSILPKRALVCDGSEVSRHQYHELFDVIGTKFGTGDGSTTFNLPKAPSPAPLIKHIIRV